MPAKQGFLQHALVTTALLKVRQDVVISIRNMGAEKGNSVSLSYVCAQMGTRWALGTKQVLKAGRVTVYGSFQTAFFHVCLCALQVPEGCYWELPGLQPSKQERAHRAHFLSLALAQSSCCQLIGSRGKDFIYTAIEGQREIMHGKSFGHGLSNEGVLGRRNVVALELPSSSAVACFL